MGVLAVAPVVGSAAGSAEGSVAGSLAIGIAAVVAVVLDPNRSATGSVEPGPVAAALLPTAVENPNCFPMSVEEDLRLVGLAVAIAVVAVAGRRLQLEIDRIQGNSHLETSGCCYKLQNSTLLPLTRLHLIRVVGL
jgi:hypothetical protein